MITPISPDTPAPSSPVTKRAHGRSLSDFVPLRPAEKQLIECCATGEGAMVGDRVPTDASDLAKIVRASFLRFLLLGGDEQTPIHEKGVQLIGAWIEGSLDLENCDVPQAIWLEKCKFNEVILARDAHFFDLLSLNGSYLLEGLRADRLNCDSSVLLRDGFLSEGEIRLLGARIAGSLSCCKGELRPKRGPAINADGLVVSGGVFLTRQFKAQGEVRFLGAQIDGDLTCATGEFVNKEGDALSVDRAVIKGHVFLNRGFKATGGVRFLGVQIGGNFSCVRSGFTAINGFGLNLETASIRDALILGETTTPLKINAAAAQIGTLIDSGSAWAKGSILDGLIYKSLGGQEPTAAATRIEWLKKQMDEHLGVDALQRDFRPQPWRQLQKVLREMGQDADAREVGVAYEDQLRKADRIGQIADTGKAKKILSVMRRGFLRSLHWLFGFLAGYGYHPLRLFMSLVWVWLCCGVIYWWLAYAPHSAIGPTDPLVFQNSAYQACTTENNGNWMLCKQLPAEYTTFSPLAYSLDVLLPLVDLGQEKRWGPLVPTPARHFCIELLSLSPPHWVRLLNWFQILYGWIASLLFVAIVSGMSRRSEMEK